MSQNQLEFVVDPVEPITTTRRVVNAPRALVWDCFTKPEHLRRWKGPKDVEMVVCECDVRPGGTWRALYRRPNGDEFGFHGEFREVVAPERFVRTFVMAANEAVETLMLTEAGPDKTLITTKIVYKTKAIRDGFVQRGMGAATTDPYVRLDELIASLATRSGTAAQTTT
ncbi:MAG TPA: SRPBCC family protein [Candidatus Cybelea sp.]|nr:SRPBCC family protein [Candidatus Cybelea sp.]